MKTRSQTKSREGLTKVLSSKIVRVRPSKLLSLCNEETALRAEVKAVHACSDCRVVLLALSILWAAAASLQAQEDEQKFYLQDGDRVVFYGDSITEQGMYSTIVETFLATRYPRLDIQSINSGWGGDTVAGGLGGPVDTRLRRDVIAHHPSVVTIMLGMNDGGYKAETAENDNRYFQGYDRLVQQVTSSLPKARMTVLGPSPYDEVTEQCAGAVPLTLKYNRTLLTFGKWLAEYAHEHNLLFADANTEFVNMLRAAHQTDPSLARTIVPGGVHPTFAGHLMIAKALLESWHARGIVSSVVIENSGKETQSVASEHTMVSLVRNAKGTEWDQLDEALPLPLAEWSAMPEDGKLVQLALKSSSIAKDLNRELLRITGLQHGIYSLRIDDVQVAAFSDEVLSEGVDLGGLGTPMSQQAMAVYKITQKKDDLQYDVWRHVRVPLAKENVENTQLAAQSLGLLVDELSQKRRTLSQPVLHHYQLVPLP